MCGNCDVIDPRSQLVAEFDKLCALYEPKKLVVTHTFFNGIYTRTGRIAAGCVIIGCKHRAKNIFHIAKGKVVVWDEINGMRTLTAPYSEFTQPGMQRIGIVQEELEGSNIFETQKTTVSEVESEMLFPFSLPPLPGEKIVAMIENIPDALCVFQK
jgi:hypothetical protein